jgi:recombination protein RecA
MDDQKSKALSAALAQIEKQFGKGSIMKMGEAQIANDLSVVSTGSLGLDIALGVGGLPRGASSKSTGPNPRARPRSASGRRPGAEGRRRGRVHRRRERARSGLCGKLGVNVGDLLISQPTRRTGLEIADMLVRSGAWTSSSSIRWRRWCPRPKSKARWATNSRPASAAHEPGAAQARRQHQACRHAGDLHQPDPDEDRVMFGNPETTTGGNALKFYASVRLDIRRIGSIKKGEEVVGNETRVKVVKNKVAPPFREALFDISTVKASRAKARSSSSASRTRSSKIRLVVRVQRRKDRPGQGQCPRVPARARADCGGDRSQDPRSRRCTDTRRNPSAAAEDE